MAAVCRQSGSAIGKSLGEARGRGIGAIRGGVAGSRGLRCVGPAPIQGDYQKRRQKRKARWKLDVPRQSCGGSGSGDGNQGSRDPAKWRCVAWGWGQEEREPSSPFSLLIFGPLTHFSFLFLSSCYVSRKQKQNETKGSLSLKGNGKIWRI